MTIADELQKLEQLHRSGVLFDEEFAKAKAALLCGPPPAPPQAGPAAADPAAIDRQTRQWAMFLHLSLLAGFMVPLGGLVLPIVIWQIKKAELPGIDVHGKIVVNWIISAFLYAVGCVILVLAIVGIPLLIALGVLGVVFPIIGAVKANDGEVWKYPLSIPFLK
ncbi:MAG: DUF4870 domain-containing protein [Planctomycetota bacterium]|nr:DUF4870 domain-containing protein [Planctomycetota bacterium]